MILTTLPAEEPPQLGKIGTIQESRRAKKANVVRDRRMHPPRTGSVRFVFHWMSQCSVWRRCSASRWNLFPPRFSIPRFSIQDEPADPATRMPGATKRLKFFNDTRCSACRAAPASVAACQGRHYPTGVKTPPPRGHGRRSPLSRTPGDGKILYPCFGSRHSAFSNRRMSLKGSGRQCGKVPF